jgi:hypothetical protein
MSKWLTWEPSQPRIMANPPATEPAKPPKPDFAGFEGALSGENPIIRGTEPTPAPGTKEQREHPAPGGKTPGACPYTLPEGVRLIRYERRTRDVAVTVCSIVDDVPKFIQHALQELDARLHHPVQIKAGDSVFELLSKLADCGVELHLEWPPKRIIENPPQSEPSKPTKLGETAESNPQPEITDEDVPC